LFLAGNRAPGTTIGPQRYSRHIVTCRVVDRRICVDTLATAVPSTFGVVRMSWCGGWRRRRSSTLERRPVLWLSWPQNVPRRAPSIERWRGSMGRQPRPSWTLDAHRAAPRNRGSKSLIHLLDGHAGAHRSGRTAPALVWRYSRLL